MKHKAIKFLFSIITTSILLTTYALAQTQFDINGPAGSDSFGEDVVVLPNGNFVVTDPDYDIPAGATDVGAAYLYSPTGTLISTLTGSTTGDRVGNRITVLTNGNYVIRSFDWGTNIPAIRNFGGGKSSLGAATWGDASTGVSGIVSAANSLIGSTAGDQVANNGITPLSNGNYVVESPDWNNGATQQVGAVTWGNGATGTSGAVSSSNSLIGSTASDRVGNGDVTALPNGNYLVISSNWNNGATQDVGAVTWANGSTGITGVVSSANSLVGSTADDRVGSFEITVLTNNNYVVRSPNWDNGGINDVGAATWGNGSTGTTGAVSSANSLIGSSANDQVSSEDVTTLTNGNYVVQSPSWDNGGTADVGAATWGNGTTGITGAVSASNSLIGSTADDQVGDRATALTNGNYVINSPRWNNGAVIDAGAATWGNGTTGIVGTISASNSLVGSTNSDEVGNAEVSALTNGNYVVSSSVWSNGAVSNVGAATWGDGTTGIIGTISSTNSLIGSTPNDNVGNIGVTPLSNGNYVVVTQRWDNGAASNVGAVTWGNGTTGITGAVSTTNSLVGSTALDNIGVDGVTALTNGNYVVGSSTRRNGTTQNAGAATWGNGTTGITGTISASNSLIGSTQNDFVGDRTIALTNGNYVVLSGRWNNGAIDEVGAATFGDGITGTSGVISPSNSLVGSTAIDRVGFQGATALPNGSYAVRNPDWDNGGTNNSGAISLLNGNMAGLAQIKKEDSSSKETSDSSPANLGPVTMINSVRGTAANGGSRMNFAFNATTNELLVGRPADNIVTRFNRLTPTAASVTVAGKVQTAAGRGIPRATVSVTDSSGQSRSVRTNSFGYFKFGDIEAGNTYIFNASAKRYSFTSQVINVSENITRIKFIADRTTSKNSKR